MVVSTDDAKRLAQRGCLIILLVTILSAIQSDRFKSALANSYEACAEDYDSPQPRPTLHNLGSFFHVQSSAHVKRAFIKYKIIPDVVDEAPKSVVRVHYSTRRGLVAKFGNVLNPKELSRRPYYLTWPIIRDAFYTLFMFDPDAVPYPDASWLNWYVVNILGDRVRSGFEIAKYLPPQPKKGSGLHRIVFLIYQQPLGDFFFYDELFYNDTRVNFTLKKILKKYHYERPVAGNFFQVQWMKPVPTRKPKVTTTTEAADYYEYESGKFLNGTI